MTLTQKIPRGLDWMALILSKKKVLYPLVLSFFKIIKWIKPGGWLKPVRPLAEPDIASAITELLCPGDLFFDIGANVGLISGVAEHVVGPTGRVIAVEPNRLLNAFIHRNTGTRTKVLNSVVGDQHRNFDFWVDQSTVYQVASKVDKTGTTPPSFSSIKISVPGILLDDLFEEYGIPRLIKLDTEGFEHVILGASKLLGQLKSPPAIIFEGTPTFESTQTVIGIFSRFNQMGDWTIYDLATRFTLDQMKAKGHFERCRLTNFIAIHHPHKLITADQPIKSVKMNSKSFEILLEPGHLVLDLDIVYSKQDAQKTCKIEFKNDKGHTLKVLEWTVEMIAASAYTLYVNLQRADCISCQITSKEESSVLIRKLDIYPSGKFQAQHLPTS